MLVRHTSQYMISSALVAVLGFMSAAVFTRLYFIPAKPNALPAEIRLEPIW